MYTYIVERTQIYLSKAQAAALDREARRTGTTRSHLIREAIEARYGVRQDRDRIEGALRATAGLWKDRTESGTAYVERLRTGRRLRQIYAEAKAGQQDR
jgi:metal-responsive CopG/Arc/MetJ family transcriptional regulator